MKAPTNGSELDAWLNAICASFNQPKNLLKSEPAITDINNRLNIFDTQDENGQYAGFEALSAAAYIQRFSENPPDYRKMRRYALLV